ncbi:hypothetical protein T484DRAFT_1806111 [Baffinella frigidus]|nr:hypothetical protein T484DRAFT_1806111 [Cryptophyta sp. CCMP2293]
MVGEVVELRRFDASSGAWEVESAGGAVSLVPKCSLALDLGLPPQLRPGAAAAYRVGTSTMLAASSSGATKSLGMFATRRIEPG